MKSYFSNVDKADRSVNSTISKYGILTKIIYPTKGHTLINYENNVTSKKVTKTTASNESLSNQFLCTGGATNQVYTSQFSFVANGSKIYIDNYLGESVCSGVNVDPKSSHNLRIENVSNGTVLYSQSTNQDTTFESKESTVALPGTPTKFPPFTTIAGNTYKITYKSTVKYSEGEHTLNIKYNLGTQLVDEVVNYSGARVSSLEDFDGEKTEIKNFKYNDLQNISNIKTSLSHQFQFNPWDFSCIFYNCNASWSTGIANNCRNTISFSSTNYVNSLNSRSNRISYEYITELRPSGGAIVNKYWIDTIDNSPQSVVNSSPKGTVNSNLSATMRGKLLENNFYNTNWTLLKKAVNTYQHYIKNEFVNYNFDFNISPYPNLLLLDMDHVYNNTVDGCTTLICNLQGKLNGDMYKNIIESYLLKNYQEINYLDGKAVVSKTEYFYDNPLYQLTKQVTTHSDSTITETTYQYAHEKNNTKLINANMIGIPLETSVLKKQSSSDPGKVIAKTETKYDNPSNLFPTSILSSDLQNSTVSSTEATYDQYDSKGNILQYTTKDGLITSIIWGYNSTQPIAKVTGVSYSVASALAADIISASNGDIDAGTEQTLIDKLDIFRKESALQNAKIATYSYDPLIGVTSITPPSGIREVYLYDSANRLKEIRQDNSTGKLLKEFKYNYKP